MASKPKPKRNKKYKPSGKDKVLPEIFRVRAMEQMAAWTGYAEFIKLEARIADETSWNLLTGRLNIGSRYSLHFPEENYSESLLKALDACVAIQRRSSVHGYVAGDLELEDIRIGLALTEKMQSLLPKTIVQECLRYVVDHAAIFD